MLSVRHFYTVESGDTVVIPTLVSCRLVAVQGGLVARNVYSMCNATFIRGDARHELTPGAHRLNVSMSKEDTDMIRHTLAATAMATAAALNVVAKPPLKPAVAARYSFDADPPKYVVDGTGNTENAWIKDHDGVTYVEGVRGKAIHLDGKALISVWKNTFALQANTAVSFWLRIDGQVGSENHRYAPGLFSSDADGSWDAFVTLALETDGKHQLILEDTKGDTARFNIAPVASGKWRHFALSVDEKGAITCYDGGKAVGTVPLESGGDVSLPIAVIGRGYGGATDRGALTGALDEVYFFNRPLTPADVAGHVHKTAGN